MTYRWLDDLDAALEAGGVPYTPIYEHGSDYTNSSTWKERGRPNSTGDFDPQGILCHHTASPEGTSDAADINCIMYGNSSAPGPISQLYIGRTGTVYLLAAGRANHGGGGMRPGIDHWCEDMNCYLVGIEAGNDGIGERWSDEQTTIYAQTVAALCLWYGWSQHQVFLHATTGPPSGGCNSKIDPAGPWQREPNLSGTWNLDTWRAFCIEQATAPLPPGEPPMTEDEYWAQLEGVVHATVLGLMRSDEYMNIVKVKATEADMQAMTDPGVRDVLQIEAGDGVLGVVRSEEFANIIRANTA